MKKLMLALALALGAANVNAADIVTDANVSAQDKQTMMAWVKNHKALIGGVVAAATAITYAGFVYKNWDAANGVATNLWTPGQAVVDFTTNTAVAGWDYTKAGAAWANENRTKTAVAVVVSAVAGYLIWDLACNKNSQVMALVKKFSTSAPKAVATEQVQVTVAA
ncbi:hypothetical protein EBZ39_17060 [bacterium]|nr:hypothetical protein [bacterium]